MAGLVYALGRVLMSLVFIVSGYQNFLNVADVAKALAGKNVPVPVQIENWTGMPRYDVVAHALALFQIVCGMMVLIGFKARFAAAMLVLLTIGTILLGQDFSTLEGAARALNETRALENLSLIGALFLIAAAGAGPWSFDGRGRGD